MKATRLQEKLNSYYLDSQESLAREGNSDCIRFMSETAGQKGLSHQERIRRIGNLLDHTKTEGSLSYFGKSYVKGLLDNSEMYVSQNSRKIKNAQAVLGQIQEIRNKLQYNPIEDFDSQQEVVASGKSYDYLWAPSRESPNIIQIRNYPTQQRRAAGHTLRNTILGLAGAAVIAWSGLVGNYIGKESQQSTIHRQESKINSYEKMIEATRAEDIAQRNALAIAGRPDNEVIENTTKELRIAYQKVIDFIKQKSREQAAKQQIKSLEQRLISLENDLENKQIIQGLQSEIQQRESVINAYEEMIDKQKTEINQQHKIITDYSQGEEARIKREETKQLEQELATQDFSELRQIAENRIAENITRERLKNSIGTAPQYRRDGFWTYAREFGHENNENFRHGPIEAGIGVLGLGYQGVIVANQSAQFVLKGPAGVVGGVGGVLSSATGINKNTGWSTGFYDGKTFVKRVGANSWGGRSLTEADGNLAGAAGSLLTLNFKQAGQKLGKGLVAPTKQERGWFNKFTAEIAYILNHIPLIADWNNSYNGHHSHGTALTGGLERIGGEINGGIVSTGGVLR